MRLIDADALIADLYDEQKHSHLMAPFKLCTADRVDLKFLLNEAPTIDAAPVVRCCLNFCPKCGAKMDGTTVQKEGTE